jgi:hypothetical protein
MDFLIGKLGFTHNAYCRTVKMPGDWSKGNYPRNALSNHPLLNARSARRETA